jgi:hypothetical protein
VQEAPETCRVSSRNKEKSYKLHQVGCLLNVTVYVSGYTETDTTGILSPPTVWRFSVAVDIKSNVFDFYFLIWSLSTLLCCVGSGFDVAVALAGLKLRLISWFSSRWARTQHTPHDIRHIFITYNTNTKHNIIIHTCVLSVT